MRQKRLNTQPHLLRFQAFSLSIEVIGCLRQLLPAFQKQDASLTKQLRSAASSISLNLAESRGRSGRDQVQFLRIAYGSAEESLACLFVAQAWGYVDEKDVTRAIDKLNHLINVIRRLIR